MIDGGAPDDAEPRWWTVSHIGNRHMLVRERGSVVDGEPVVELSQTNMLRAMNLTGVEIQDGSLVRIVGAEGVMPLIELVDTPAP